MLLRIPDYFDRFHCLAKSCPHSCCIGWEVVLDEDTVLRYQRAPGDFGNRLRAAMERDGDGDMCFPLRGGRCPFLDGENLCEIHRRLGEAATSVTCRQHPRFTEDYGPFREISLSAACPAANTLLLSNDAPLTFQETEDGEPTEDGDAWLPFLLPLRTRLLEILQDRTQQLGMRLERFLCLAAQGQMLLDEERVAELPALAKQRNPECAAPDVKTASFTAKTALPDATLTVLKSLDILEPSWRTLLERAGEERAVQGTATAPQLERIIVYLAFRHLLKTVNDGDLLSRAKLCALAVLLLDALSALCPLSEALRLFSREIEHDEDNLNALLDTLAADDAFSLPVLRQTAIRLRI